MKVYELETKLRELNPNDDVAMAFWGGSDDKRYHVVTEIESINVRDSYGINGILQECRQEHEDQRPGPNDGCYRNNIHRKVMVLKII